MTRPYITPNGFRIYDIVIPIGQVVQAFTITDEDMRASDRIRVVDLLHTSTVNCFVCNVTTVRDGSMDIIIARIGTPMPNQAVSMTYAIDAG